MYYVWERMCFFSRIKEHLTLKYVQEEVTPKEPKKKKKNAYRHR